MIDSAILYHHINDPWYLVYNHYLQDNNDVRLIGYTAPIGISGLDRMLFVTWYSGRGIRKG
jgi:hypothetical protein